MSGIPCGNTLIGSPFEGLFHCQGTGPFKARWYMVRVWRTTTNAWTASKASVPGVWMKSPKTFGLTDGMPGIPFMMRASLGPAKTPPGRYTFRMPISVTDGSCFQISEFHSRVLQDPKNYRLTLPIPQMNTTYPFFIFTCLCQMAH